MNAQEAAIAKRQNDPFNFLKGFGGPYIIGAVVIVALVFWLAKRKS